MAALRAGRMGAWAHGRVGDGDQPGLCLPRAGAGGGYHEFYSGFSPAERKAWGGVGLADH